jgi:uncharacterized protein (TIGR03435 family)
MAGLFRRPRLLAATALLAASADTSLWAQQPANSPRQFDVASVRPTLSPYELGREAGRLAASGGAVPVLAVSFGVHTYPGGRLTANANLRSLIAWAYEVKEYEIDGGPNWMGEAYFVIDARAGGDATAAEFREMLKALLAERFGLRTHSATRPGRMHGLVLARADGRIGPGLKPTSAECLAQIEERERTAAASAPAPPAPVRVPRSGPPDMTPRCRTYMVRGSPSGATTLTVSGEPLTILVEHLAEELRATVVDRTGLEGRFDLVVEFETQRTNPGLGRGGLDPNSTESPRPPLRSAIERQLCLKIESVEAQVPILVVDAAERPTPN